jgi:hypothetical protein
MLAATLNVPNTDTEWSLWSLNNYTVVNAIRAAVLAQKNITLPEYQIEPIPWNDLETWLNNNQQAHNDFNAALGLQSSDILHTNLKDPNERALWVYLNYMELSNACQTLAIGP